MQQLSVPPMLTVIPLYSDGQSERKYLRLLSPGWFAPHRLQSAAFLFAAMWLLHCAGAQQAWAAAASTTTTLAVTSGGSQVSSVDWGAEVALTATVNHYGAAVTTGEVDFCDATATHCTDSHLLGTAQLTSAGTAVLKLRPGVGSHSYKAVFLGTAGDVASSSSVATLTVTAVGTYPTGTAIEQSGTVGYYTLTAIVFAAEGTTAPTGTVSFLDTSNANQVLASAAVVGTSGKGWVGFPVPVAGNSPVAIATGDFNGDGIPDLVVGYGNDEQVTILLGNGNGTLTAAPNSVRVDNTSYFMAAGDFNGDGIPDLAIVTTDAGDDSGPGSARIWLGNGDGTFTWKASPATGGYPQCVAVGDFNGDGIPDLAVANYGSKTVTILLGMGDGTFTAAAVSPTTGPQPYFVAVGDFNGDGKADLAVANSGDSSLTILLGNGDGTFRAAASPPTGSGPSAIAVGDFNGDGKTDLAVSNLHVSTVTVLLGNGDGTFAATPESPATGNSPAYIATGDFNGDGIPDLAVANLYGNTVTILQGKGDGTFATVASPVTGANPGALAVGDFSGDGLSDLATANFTSNDVTVLLAQELSSIATVSGISPARPGTHLVEASYPGDSIYDPSTSGTTPLITEVPVPAFTPLAGTYNAAQSVTITDAAAGTTIYYTTNGTTPTTSSTRYSGPITVSANETLRAFATFPGVSPSVVATAVYIISPVALPSTLTVSGGPTVAGGSVTLTATVNVASGTPSGEVTFSTSRATLGAAMVESGVATLPSVVASAADGLGEGSDLVTARYSGDGSFLASNGSFELQVYGPSVPLLLSLSPSTAIAAGATFALAVTGANFASKSVVLWNGQPRPTSYMSGSHLTATIFDSDIAKERTSLVTVASPAPDAGTSWAQPFVVMSSTPKASISAVTIADAADGSGNRTLALTGSDFVSASVVKWNGTALTTLYVSPRQTAATIPAAHLGSPATITVTNPAGASAGFHLP